MTLNGRNFTLAEVNKMYGSHQKKFNEDRLILLAAKCRPMTLGQYVSPRHAYRPLGPYVASSEFE